MRSLKGSEELRTESHLSLPTHIAADFPKGISQRDHFVTFGTVASRNRTNNKKGNVIVPKGSPKGITT